MSSILLNSNIKTFLKYELINFKNNLFSIYFLENNFNQITKTTPLNTTTINNIHNTPDKWLFHNPNTTIESSNIDFIQIQTIKKTTKKLSSTQSSTTTQFYSRYVNTRSATKIKNNIENYMTKLKLISNHNNTLFKKFIEKEFQKNLQKNSSIILSSNQTTLPPNKKTNNKLNQ